MNNSSFEIYNSNIFVCLDCTSTLLPRLQPTGSDIATSIIIFKIRKKQNNTEINTYCNLMRALNVPEMATSWKSIKRKMELDVSSKWFCCKICNICGMKAIDQKSSSCFQCKSNVMVEFYYYPLAEQLQHLLLMPNVYNQMKHQQLINKENLRATKYGHILNSESGEFFTMIINIDGVVTKNKHISLWPLTIMINEIPLPNRRYLEFIILGGVLPASKHPSNKLFQTVMNIIYEQCAQLEAGVKFFIPGVGEQTVKFFLIASCTDKPAQSLLTNMVAHNSNYSCAKCFIKGIFIISQFNCSSFKFIVLF
jgi:hypothetical protein